MINLLPPDIKENYRYSRKNTVMVKLAIGLFVGVFGIMVVIAWGRMYLDSTASAYNGLVNQTKTQISTNHLSDAKKQIDGITNNLKLVTQVLSREVLFSKLLTQIGNATPPGSVLTNLTIDEADTGQGLKALDMQAAATNYQAASQIQVNMQDPNNKLFSKADIVSIQCQTTSAGAVSGVSAAYPCQVDIRAQFATSSSFLLINSKSGNGT